MAVVVRAVTAAVVAVTVVVMVVGVGGSVWLCCRAMQAPSMLCILCLAVHPHTHRHTRPPHTMPGGEVVACITLQGVG